MSPSIESASPSSNITPNTFVTIKGTGYSRGARVFLNNSQMQSVTVLSSDKLTFRLTRPEGVERNPSGELVTVVVELETGERSNPFQLSIRTLRVLVIGDSIMWGQGLLEENKFYTKVTKELERRSGMGAYALVYAHSGATILKDDVGYYVKHDGEVPLSNPTIPRQIEKAIEDWAFFSVDLILINGGINDINAQNLVNPTLSDDELIQEIGKIYPKAFGDSLLKLRDNFASARIIVVGYYEIISTASTGLTLLLKFIEAMGVTITALPSALASAGALTEVAILRMANNCKQFRTLSDKLIAEAVHKVGVNTYFIPAPFEDANAVLASNPYLYAINPNLSPQGNTTVQAVRAAACEAEFGNALSIELLKCQRASAGHPNIAGANAYFKAIGLFLPEFAPMSNQSFREVADFMNRWPSITTLRGLSSRHRWANRSDHISLKSILVRHNDSRSRRLHILSYNAWLMELSIPLAKYITDWSRFGDVANVLRLDPLLILRKLEIDALLSICDTETLKALFVDLSTKANIPLPPGWSKAFEAHDSALRAIKRLLKDSQSVLGSIGEALIAALQEVLDLAPMQLMMKVCQKNAIDIITILSWLGIQIPNYVDISVGCPDIKLRSAELGAILSSQYDVAALCEVWQPSTCSSLIESIEEGGCATQISTSRKIDPADGLMGDGLISIGINRRVQPIFHHVFSQRGPERGNASDVINHLVDADVWSDKGVLLSLIDVEIGTIELYTTHLYSGGGLLGFLDLPSIGLSEATREQKRLVRSRQLDEVVEFIKSHHVLGNVILLAGDLNIDANSHDDYLELITKLQCITIERDGVISNICLVDAWAHQRHFYEDAKDGRGTTNSNYEKSLLLEPGATSNDRFAKLCVRKEGHGDYCDDSCSEDIDYLESLQTVGRIDYVFIQSPSKENKFNLDLTRIMRRHFEREGHSWDEAHYLSDHLGLDFYLLVSCK